MQWTSVNHDLLETKISCHRISCGLHHWIAFVYNRQLGQFNYYSLGCERSTPLDSTLKQPKSHVDRANSSEEFFY